MAKLIDNFKSKNLQPKSLHAVTYGCRFNPSQRQTATAKGLTARRSLTAQDLRRSIPGNGHSANNKFDLHASSGTGRTPTCEYAKPRKPARKNTGHEMCDLTRDMNRAMRVVERTDFLDDLGDRVIRKINGGSEMGKFENLPEQLMAVFMLGFPVAGLLIGAVLLGLAWRKALAWIDDAEAGRNPVLEFMARLRGWTPYTTEGNGYQWWKDKKGSTQTEVLLPFLGLFFFSPLAVFLAIKLYPVVMAAMTLVAVAFVARFARRHKKLFDKHLKDPEAHK